MHIAYLIPTIGRIGGAERQLIQLATGMSQRHWQASVIALSGEAGEAASKLASSRVSFLSLGMRKGLLDPRGWMRLHHWIHSNHPEVIHAHLPHAALFARWSRLAAPVRILLDTIHSPNTGGIARRIAYRATSSLPDVVTAVSPSAAEPWLNARMLNRSYLAVIPNGVDVSFYQRDDTVRAAARRRSTNEFVWLAVGRLDAVKDHATLLRAFARLPTSARLLIAGTGSLESSLKQLSLELGIGARVRFLGFQNNILPWMQSADAFVLSSQWEGLPVALMEASACELPAVVTSTPGSREVLPDSPGNPVPVGDATALATAMEALMLKSEAERHELGGRARRFVAQHFNHDAVLDRHEALYRQALAINPQLSRWRAAASHLGALCRSSTTER